MLTAYRFYSQKESYIPNTLDTIDIYKQDYSYFSGNVILHYQQPIKKNKFIRTSVSFGKTKTINSIKNNNKIHNTFSQSNDKIFTYNTAVSIDYYLTYKPQTYLEIYYGAGFLTWCSLPTKVVNYGSETNSQNQKLNITSTYTSNTVFGLNLNSMIGVKYYLSKNFFIGNEIKYTISLGSINSDKKIFTSETTNTTTNQKQKTTTYITNRQNQNIGTFFDYIHVLIGYNLNTKK